VQTHTILVSKGRDSVHAIRSELFVFPEVLDVFVTGRPEVLVVVCQGRPRPAEWLRALRAVGYEVLARRHGAGAARDSGVDPLLRADPAPIRPLTESSQRCAA
jgi:hypothetical protein